MQRGISIIIPVFNGARYIRRCIDSILCQDYSDCQIIIIDDGSSDDTLKICHQMVGLNSAFDIIHQENQGVSAARNAGIGRGKMEWIYFLDADDELDQGALETMKRFLDSNSQWIVMNYKKQVEGTQVIEENVLEIENLENFAGKKGFAELLNSGLFKYPCGKLYKTDIIQKNNIQFPLKVVYGEDIRFNLRYFCFVDQYIIQPSSAFIYHIRQGEGAGSAYYKDSFQMQMDIDLSLIHI